MADSQKFVLNPAFKAEKFDNEVLLYAVSNTRGVYLNETASLVWEMYGQNLSIDKIITLLEEAYPQQKEAIREDVATAFESLIENGALIACND